MMIKFLISAIMVLVFEYLSSKEYEHFYMEVNSIKIRSMLMNKLHKRLTTTKVLGPFNVYCLLFLIVMIFGYVTLVSYTLTELYIPSMSAGLLFAVIPLLCLDIKSQAYHNDLSLEVTKFISCLTRWAIVKDDVYFCFSKSIEQIDGPLKVYVKEFLMQIKYSGHINFAFDHIIRFTQHEMLRNLMINLQQTAYCKGDLVGILERLEEESYLIYGEHERRKTETYFDKLAIYFSIVCVLVITIVVLTINIRMREFYLETTAGNYILSLFSMLFILGVYLASKIRTFNY